MYKLLVDCLKQRKYAAYLLLYSSHNDPLKTTIIWIFFSFLLALHTAEITTKYEDTLRDVYSFYKPGYSYICMYI